MATYTSLQYIQSNGEQYIDTGYGFTGNDYLYINFSIVKAPHYQKTANTDLFSLKARVESGETESAPLDCDCRTGSGTQTSTYIYLRFWYPTEVSSSGFSSSGKDIISRVENNELKKYTINFDAKNSKINNSSITYLQTNLDGRRNLILLGNPKSEPSPLCARIYSCYIKNNNDYVRNFKPVRREDDGAVGLLDTTNNVFYSSPNSNFIAGPSAGTRISAGMNYVSFINALVKRCKYLDGSDLSDIHTTKLYEYFVALALKITSNLQKIINIYEARRLLRYFTDRIAVVNQDYSEVTYLDCALSKNTAINLINALSKDEIQCFMNLGDIYGSNSLNDYNYNTIGFSIVDSSDTLPFVGILHGGGGGGGGGLAGDGDKNSNYYGASGKGAAGGTSIITLNGTEKVTAAGGAGGGNRTLGNTGGDPGSIERPGNAGGAGATTEVNIQIARDDIIKISPGYGGGGGGGIGISTNNGSSYSAANGSEAKGGDGKEANSFTSDDQCFGGGGGEGGHGTGYTTTGIGANKESGPNHQSWFDASYQSKGVGGNGGWSNCTDDAGNKANADQPKTIGAGGNGGRGKNWVDEVTHGNGGNGGNAGGFVADTSIANYLIKIKYITEN